MSPPKSPPNSFIERTATGKPAKVRLAHILDEKPKYVVSSHEPASAWNARRIEADSIRTLKLRTDGALLLVASPTLVRTLLQWNLVDEYHVAISPLVAGRGPTFLAGLQRGVRATLLDLNRLSSGVVIHRYGFAH
jgi:dihydrofolate reductase